MQRYCFSRPGPLKTNFSPGCPGSSGPFVICALQASHNLIISRPQANGAAVMASAQAKRPIRLIIIDHKHSKVGQRQCNSVCPLSAMCGRLRVGKSFSSRLQHWSVRPCVRPLGAVHMTAGHNALRGSGPGQNLAFDNALVTSGLS